MSFLGNFLGSSIGRKFLMAVTGVVLVLFVTGHLVGNLQIFASPDRINGYAHFLQSLGPALWVVRLFMLACAAIHVWAAVTLHIENYRARGPEKYAVHRWLSAALASRYMRSTGVVIGAFLVYHLMQFSFGTGGTPFKTELAQWTMHTDAREFGLSLAAKGDVVDDVYSMVFLGFSNAFVAIFYVIAVGLLSLHLWHGTESFFQTLGWRNDQWTGALRRVVAVYSLLYFLGNLAIPGAILSGLVRPAPGTTAAQRLAAPAVPPTAVAHR
jgi:succinate dehydrogenase / fumarate reductase cytochrome b subunit